MELIYHTQHSRLNQVHGKAMTPEAKITPPLAQYLKQLDQARRDFAKGVFPAEGLITPVCDSSSGYLVRIWDKTGAKTIQCPTAADVNMCLIIAKDRALTGCIARQVSHQFYQSIYDSIDARKPFYVTNAEARLCGAYRRIVSMMVDYNAVLQEREEGNPTAQKRFRILAVDVDRAIRRLNQLFEEL